MPRKTKDDCHRHAIKRARERYQVWFTQEEMKRLSDKVGKAGSLHLLTESVSRTHWLIDDQYIVVYNKNLRAITTFLPPECIFNYLPKRA
jgi:hypothetical protein